jgi:hypothetical protein
MVGLIWTVSFKKMNNNLVEKAASIWLLISEKSKRLFFWINYSKAQTSVIIAPIPTRHPFAPHLGSLTKLVDHPPLSFIVWVVEETQIPCLFWMNAASLFLCLCFLFYLFYILLHLFGQMLLQSAISCHVSLLKFGRYGW